MILKVIVVFVLQYPLKIIQSSSVNKVIVLINLYLRFLYTFFVGLSGAEILDTYYYPLLERIQRTHWEGDDGTTLKYGGVNSPNTQLLRARTFFTPSPIIYKMYTSLILVLELPRMFQLKKPKIRYTISQINLKLK